MWLNSIFLAEQETPKKALYLRLDNGDIWVRDCIQAQAKGDVWQYGIALEARRWIHHRNNFTLAANSWTLNHHESEATLEKSCETFT